jgi:hypothetical protein
MSYDRTSWSCFGGPPILSIRLRGEKPGDIPIEQPTKFDLVTNLTTAKAPRVSMKRRSLILQGFFGWSF